MDRGAFLKLLGPLPTRAPLDVEVLEDVDCGSYTRSKLAYSAEPNERIPAYLLIPKRLKGKAAAVFCHHQHNGEFHLGKSEVVGLAGDPDQAYAAELAERGYVVLAPDAIAFEERNWSRDPGKAEYFELATRLVGGRTLMAKVLSDVAAGLDLLESRPEVDASRIGFLGHSYGGRMALWAPAFDKRIKASMSNCGCVNYKDSLSREVGIQMEFCVPDFLSHGDVEDVVRLAAQASLLIFAADDDVWSLGAQGLYDHAKSAFREGDLRLKIWPGKHVFTQEMRQEAYAFLDERLRATGALNPSSEERLRRAEVLRSVQACVASGAKVKLPPYDPASSPPGSEFALQSIGSEPNDFGGTVGPYRYQFEGEEDLLHLFVARLDGAALTAEEGQSVAGFVLEGVPPAFVWLRPGEFSQHFYLAHDHLGS